MNVEYQVLPASEVAVGHCVIVNDYDQTCGNLVAVVVAIEGDNVRTKYLSDWRAVDQMNKVGCINPAWRVTPVATFGVEVRVDADGRYWCERVGESSAEYPDGKRRLWQENGTHAHRARADVLTIAGGIQ